MWKFYTTYYIFLVLIKIASSRDVTEEKYDSVTNIIELAGYPVEVHTVITQDGYILKMHRIPYGTSKYLPEIIDKPFNKLIYKLEGLQSDGNKRESVLLMHGLLCSAADWVVAGPKIGLAYTLADAGYDVWLVNARGTTLSRKHVRLDPSSPQFWEFSWHEIGVYDTSACIDYILDKTGSDTINYIGHSQGATTLFTLLSTNPRYNSKIKVAILTAPIAFMTNIENPMLRTVGRFIDEIEVMANTMRFYEIFPSSEAIKMITSLLCHDRAKTQELCSTFIFMWCGFDSEQLNRTLLPSIFENMPSGVSVRQFVHYGQLFQTGKFQMFDYRLKKKNMKIYKRNQPPEYSLSNVKLPVALLFGTADVMNSEHDVNILATKLPNVIAKIPIAGWNHLDFLYAIDSNKIVGKRVLKILGDYNSCNSSCE